jgi:Fe-S cluster assembly protein SufD
VTALPTRKDEAWRYSDIDAVASLWPVPPALEIALKAGEARQAALVADGGIRDFAITLGAGARYDFRILNIAQRYSRIAIDVTLHEGADFNLGVAQIAGGDATVEIVTTVTHAEPGATSRQIVRSVAGGKGTVTYLGKVAVARDAQQTDSEQDVKAMLLERSATANAKPELEIFADDVKCAHGCAVGELDANALFYLQSRGMTPAEAKQVMLQAFVAGVFDGAEDAERLQGLALAKLGELVC